MNTPPNGSRWVCGDDCLEFQGYGHHVSCRRVRDIDADWPHEGDEGVPGRFIRQLADALWRYENAPNFATLGALRWACAAIAGDEEARADLDTSPAWIIRAGEACVPGSESS